MYFVFFRWCIFSDGHSQHQIVQIKLSPIPVNMIFFFSNHEGYGIKYINLTQVNRRGLTVTN